MQDEKLIGAAIVVEDITEEKLLEKTRDEFFSVTSHELRTPLTAIRGNAAMVQQYYADQIKDEDAKQMITDIHTASIRLIAIVNNFLDVSRLELNKITFTPEKFDMVPVVKGSMRELEQSAREKGLSWDLDMQDEGVYWVQADKSRGQQVLVNLLGNAVKYTKSGGVRVWVEQDRVVRVKVSDTGIGIAEDQVQFLFQKFRQVGAVGFTRNVSQSSGLGLYVTKLLVEQMGGRVYLEWSELGKGSTFTVELPKAA
jgi:signal transduction histidine kinase